MSFDRRFPATMLAWRNLSRNRLRSALATLGIVIGVFAIASLGIFGNVLQLSAAHSLGDIGTQVVVSPNAETGQGTLSPRDVQEIQRVTAGHGTAVPLKSGRAVVTSGNDRAAASLYGTNDPKALFRARHGTLPDSLRGGILLGPDVADSLHAQVGSVVDIEGNQYRVVGVLAPSQTLSPVSSDNAVVLPEDQFVQDRYDRVVVTADSGKDATYIADTVEARLNAREKRVSVFQLSSVLNRINDFFDLLNGFLIGIGGISLVVAGVSIFNVMLMSTTERRAEIGVFRAVGIQKHDVLRTLLIEATLLGVVGGTVGALSGLLTAFGLYYFTPITLDVLLVPSTALYLLVAFAFGVLVSVLSGLYPAWKAANERPVDALRN